MRRVTAIFFDTFFYIAIVTVLIGLIVFPVEVSASVMESLTMCVKLVIPSLFPFFVVAGVIVYSGFSDIIGARLGKVMRFVFGLPGEAGVPFFLGILSGYPVGANTALSLYKNGTLTKAQAEHLLSFCNNSGPAFVLGTIGVGIWSNTSAGILLYVCHVVSCIIVGIVFRFITKSKNIYTKPKAKNKSKMPYSVCIVKAVKSSAENIFYITAFVVFFAVIIQLMSQFKILPCISKCISDVFSLPSNLARDIVGGFFEMTAGVRAIGIHNGNRALKLVITSGVLSWAGLSVHCQVLSFLSGSGLSAIPYISGKLLQSVVASVLTLFATRLCPMAIAASSINSNLSYDTYFSPMFFFAIIAAAISILFLIKKRVEIGHKIYYNKLSKRKTN